MSKLTGFMKPIEVSEELGNFIGLAPGDLIARTQVTSKINEYCKEKDLQKAKGSPILLPDTPLCKILRVNEGAEITFFNLQKHLKHHYPNKDGEFSNIVRFQSKPSTTMIKVWSEEENRWTPSFYYFKPSMLPRTVGYMCQRDINDLPTRAEVIKNIYRAKL